MVSNSNLLLVPFQVDIYHFSGIVKRRWKPQIVGKELDVELVFKANHIQINNDISSVGFVKPDIKENFDNFWKQYENNPLDGRAVILQSMCPEVSNLHLHLQTDFKVVINLN